MNFSLLEVFYQKWSEILVIGKTIERNDKKYHIVGMTLDTEAKLYIMEPYHEPNDLPNKRKGVNNQRQRMKEQKQEESSYLNCTDFYIGDQRLNVRSGSGGSLKYSLNDYGTIQLFFEMMGAGWVIPEWLKSMEWDHWQLVTLSMDNVKKLPTYSSEMSITIKHNPPPLQHIIEKTITLNVGKSRSFSFTDNHGDKVQCYINHVTLIDVWKTMEERFCNPKYIENISQEELQQIKKHCYEMLEESCPKGMCYVGIEYECSKEMSVQFYSKQFLKSSPIIHTGSAVSIGMMLKPDEKIGTHHLPLKGCVIQTAVSPDTTKIPAELFYCFEKVDIWEEKV